MIDHTEILSKIENLIINKNNNVIKENNLAVARHCNNFFIEANNKLNELSKNTEKINYLFEYFSETIQLDDLKQVTNEINKIKLSDIDNKIAIDLVDARLKELKQSINNIEQTNIMIISEIDKIKKYMTNKQLNTKSKVFNNK